MANNGNAGEVVLKPGVLAAVPSKSDAGRTHEIRLSRNGVIYCDCPGFAWRGHCSHVGDLVESWPELRVLVRAGVVARIRSLEQVLEGMDSGA